jgi:hypothetical protein
VVVLAGSVVLEEGVSATEPPATVPVVLPMHPEAKRRMAAVRNSQPKTLLMRCFTVCTGYCEQ